MEIQLKTKTGEYKLVPISKISNNLLYTQVHEGEYSISVKVPSTKKYSFAVYIDGINIMMQNNTQYVLSDIKDVTNYKQHATISVFDELEYTFENYFSSTSPKFKFVEQDEKKVSSYINNSGYDGRITVFVWEEGRMKLGYGDNVRGSMTIKSADRGIGTGLGEDTFVQLKTGKGLQNPTLVTSFEIIYESAKDDTYFVRDFLSQIPR